MDAHAHRFSHAITRKPGRNVIAGISSANAGGPDVELFARHHTTYVAALESTGATVTVLEPLDRFPDSVFIEDTALCLPEGAVLMRPGAPSRLGEVAAVAPVLRSHYPDVHAIEGPGTLEAGDILVTGREILVGHSKRTNAAGVAQLRRIVERWGHAVRECETPPGVLHYKTDCSLLDEETILATKRLSKTGCFDGYRVLHCPDGEEAAANSIRFNDIVVMPAGFPRTAELLTKEGYDIREIGNSEAAKLDGGMSCLSLRFSPPA